MANHNYIEHDINMSNNDQEEDKGSQEQEIVDPVIGVITLFKGERALKRPATEVTNMDIDTATKNPRIYAQGKEIVDLDNDDEESINQIKGIQITEEPAQRKEASHPASPSVTHSTSASTTHSTPHSHSKKTISQIVTTGQSSEPIINVQQFVFNANDSPYESKHDLVKKFSEERNLSTE